ncbi:MAG TPA: hypothetical protein VH481_08265 [Nitrososphaeraceae archaeon]
MVVVVIVTTSILTFVVIGLLSPQNNNSLHSRSNLKAYINPVYGMEILYPAQWQVFQMGKGSMIVGFLSYPQDKSGMLENVIVRTIDPSYYDLTLQDVAQKELTIYKSQLHSFQLHSLSSGKTSLGFPVYRMEYSHHDDQLDLKTMEILIRDSNHIYSIVYSSDALEYPFFVSQVEKMIDSMVLGHQEHANQKANYYLNEPFISL